MIRDATRVREVSHDIEKPFTWGRTPVAGGVVWEMRGAATIGGRRMELGRVFVTDEMLNDPRGAQYAAAEIRDQRRRIRADLAWWRVYRG